MRSHLFVIALVLSAFASNEARASSFDISPVSLTLSEKATSGMFALTNRSKEPLRFHITAFSWEQRSDGEMILTPTKDIVFFPAMLTLNPMEARNLRVGMSIKPGDVEKSYRIFIQELPPLATAEDQGTVRVLTKMGVPVFVQGSSSKPVPAVNGLALNGQKLTFNLQNSGNAHYRTDKITVKAKDVTGKVVHSQDVAGWYMLAKSVRNYAVSLPIETCGTFNSIEVEIQTEDGSPKATLGNAVCTR